MGNRRIYFYKSENKCLRWEFRGDIIKYVFRHLRQQCDLLRCNYNLRAYACQLIDRLRLSFDVICAKDFEVDIAHLSAHSFHSTSSVTRFFTPFHWSMQCNVVHLHSLVWLPNVSPPFASKNSRLSWPLLTCNLSLTILTKIELFTFCVVAFCV